MKSKEDLLKELQELGVHPTGRKVRADKGANHDYVRTQTTPRADKGKTRLKYSKESPKYVKKLFFELLRKNTDAELGEGDNFIRDNNMIFPPNVTQYYKKITVKPHTRVDKRTGSLMQQEGYSYRTSRKKNSHPEELRWRWYMAEYKQAKNKEDELIWQKRICEWYFILPDDIDIWTYQEWAWSYVKHIGGIYNRTDNPIILLYDSYVIGNYGIPNWTLDGEIIW